MSNRKPQRPTHRPLHRPQAISSGSERKTRMQLPDNDAEFRPKLRPSISLMTSYSHPLPDYALSRIVFIAPYFSSPHHHRYPIRSKSSFPYLISNISTQKCIYISGSHAASCIIHRTYGEIPAAW